MGGLLSPSWSPFSDAPGSAALSQMVDPSSASPRQISSTPSPVLLSNNLRKILGPNPHLSDNKLLRSWEYAALMMAYCAACTLFGVLAVTLLPDPQTLELIRGGGGEDDQRMDNKVDYVGYKKGYGVIEVAHNMVGPFGPMDDTDGYKQSYKAIETAHDVAGAFGAKDNSDGYYQGLREQNDSGIQEATTYRKQGSMSDRYNKYRIQDIGVEASDGTGKKKPLKEYNRYKDKTGEPPKNYYDYWAQSNNKHNTFKSSPEKQGPEDIPPSTHYQAIQEDGGSLEGSIQSLASEESSYTSYISRPS